MPAYTDTIVIRTYVIGQVGTLRYSILSLDGQTVHVAPTLAGIVEQGDGQYVARPTIDTEWGPFVLVRWTDATRSLDATERFATAASSNVSPAGARLVTFTVTSGGAGVPGVKVRIAGPTPNVGETNGDGVLQMGADDGDYVVTVAKGGFQPVPPFSLHVVASVSHAVTLTPIVSTVPADPSLSSVTARVIDVAGSPIVGATIAYRIIDPPAGMSGVFDAAAKTSAPTDSDGVTRFDVLLGSRVRFEYGGASAIATIDAPTFPLTMRGRL